MTKKSFKTILVSLLALTMLLSLTGCGEKQEPASEAKSINIAYQYGLAYAPLAICQNQKLIESAYQESTGKTLNVVWTQMSSGADINTGIASGSVQAGFMGVAPAITGISKNLGYKVFTNLSGQKNGLMTSAEEIHSVGDIIGTANQIALVNIGSIQHIILAKALAENGYDAHALDANIIAMKHPDGMTALQTGNLSCHLTSNPYIYKEAEDPNLHELTEVAEAWPADRSFIIGIASEKMHDEDPRLYDALCKAIEKAVAFINDSPDQAAAITAEPDGNTVEDELKYLGVGTYTVRTSGILELARFMYSEGFIDNEIASFSDMAFSNVTGD